MQKFLHFLYTVVAILFVNALFQTLESAVSISGIASVVYSAAKCVIFLITIAASVAIFRAKFKQVKEESSQNSRIADQIPLYELVDLRSYAFPGSLR